jgi:hypothetical protein
MTAGLLGSVSVGCSSSATSPSDCPSYLVAPEQAPMGFSSVGAWRSDDVCTDYCRPDYPVCQLKTPTTVKCQKGCQ